MMQPLKSYLKKFLLAYAFSVSMVIIYFLIKTLISEPEDIELKSFHHPTERPLKQEKESTQDLQRQDTQKMFILLPQQ